MKGCPGTSGEEGTLPRGVRSDLHPRPKLGGRGCMILPKLVPHKEQQDRGSDQVHENVMSGGHTLHTAEKGILRLVVQRENRHRE